MKLEDCFPYTFKAMRARLGIQSTPPMSGGDREGLHVSWVDRARSDDSELCHEMITTYGFTEEQMHRDAKRFKLGRSKSGKTIYWMIDEMGIHYDGCIGDSYVSSMLKIRFPEIATSIDLGSCLFGQHQLFACRDAPIGLVESARSAVLLSEIYPDLIWMAYVIGVGFTEYSLEPLQGHKIILYPNAEDGLNDYLAFLDIADHARRKFHLDVTVSSFLEDHATPDQKSRGIDLVDYLFST